MVSACSMPSQWRPEQVRDALVTVDEEADRLNRLVGNLLDASRLQSVRWP
jgi:K+-sensing histidine kinase KdpD